MSDVSLYPQRVYRNADPERAWQWEKKRQTSAWISDAENVAMFKNKTESRALTSYCQGVDGSKRYTSKTISHQRKQLVTKLDRLLQVERLHTKSTSSLLTSSNTNAENTSRSSLPSIHTYKVRDRCSTMPCQVTSCHKRRQLHTSNSLPPYHSQVAAASLGGSQSLSNLQARESKTRSMSRSRSHSDSIFSKTSASEPATKMKAADVSLPKIHVTPPSRNKP